MTTPGRGRGSEITLKDGPGNGQHYWKEGFLERIRTAERRGRGGGPNIRDFAGWALGYQRTTGTIWEWRGIICHQTPLD